MSPGGISSQKVRNSWTDELIEKLRIGASTGMTDGELARLLGMSRSAVVGARWRYGVPATRSPFDRRPIPQDFREVAPTMTVEEASRRYGAAPSTVKRWHKECGTVGIRRFGRPAMPKGPSERRLRAARPTGVKRGPRVRDHRLFSVAVPAREGSIAARAQLHLQRFGPCFRARTIDPQAANDQWIYMGRRMSEAELLAIAQRKGMAA